jgi:hypothetical protein
MSIGGGGGGGSSWPPASPQLPTLPSSLVYPNNKRKMQRQQKQIVSRNKTDYN